MSAQVIGYLGENGVRDVRIPIGHLLDKWQGLRPLLVMVPVGGSDDEAYPVQYTLEGTDLVWHVSDADTAVAGTTKAAVRMVDDSGRVGMDEPFQVIISPNLSAGGNPPVVIKPWVDKLATLVPRAEAAAERAENATERAENAAERVETGTSPNALALGGKPPEYYLPAVNLLVNGDFAITQEGYNGYHGNDLYHADRWYGNGNGVLSVSGNVKTFTSSSGFAIMGQKLWNDGRDQGRQYTLVVTLPDGNRIACSGTSPSAPATSEVVFADMYAPDARCWFNVMKNPDNSLVVRVDASQAGASVNFLHMDMFEGVYTAENAPHHVQRPYATELVECRRFYRPKVFQQIVGIVNQHGRLWYISIPMDGEMHNTPSLENFSIVYLGGETGEVNGVNLPDYTVAHYRSDKRCLSVIITFSSNYPKPFTNAIDVGYMAIEYALNADLQGGV